MSGGPRVAVPQAHAAGTARPLRAAGHALRVAAAQQDAGPPAPSPRRAVVILPGLGNAAGDYAPLAAQLRARGLAVEVADVARVDWLRNAAGLRYADYWRGTLTPRPTVDWYLQRVDAAVDAAKRAAGGAPVTLLAHSAGGWLSRVYLKDYGTAGIDRLVSLGSPHTPPPAGVVDQTRGILTYCADACPGAFHPEVAYVTIAGKYIFGAPLLGPGGGAGGEGGESEGRPTWQQRVVGAGYQQVCGRADVWGDGITPLPSAHLEGAENLDLLGVYHSPLGSVDGDDAGARPWYGTPAVLEQWVGRLAAGPGELLAPPPPPPQQPAAVV